MEGREEEEGTNPVYFRHLSGTARDPSGLHNSRSPRALPPPLPLPPAPNWFPALSAQVNQNRSNRPPPPAARTRERRERRRGRTLVANLAYFHSPFPFSPPKNSRLKPRRALIHTHPSKTGNRAFVSIVPAVTKSGTKFRGLSHARSQILSVTSAAVLT